MSGENVEDTSSIVSSMLTGDREGVGGILCNDSSGLSVAAEGNLDPSHSGIFTNLTRLASKLTALKDGNDTVQSPLVVVETDDSAILVKEYEGGNGVALRVPLGANSNATASNGS